jgi:DNA-binding transcriptional regulator YhcF (GntR family)
MGKNGQSVDWEEVLALVDEKIPASRVEHLRKHVKECEQCREKLEKAGESSGKVRKTEHDASQTGGLPILIRNYRWPLLISGGLVLLLLLGLLGLWQDRIRSFATAGRPTPEVRMKQQEDKLAEQRASEFAATPNDALYDENQVSNRPSKPLASAPMIARSVALTIVAKDFGGARASLEALLAKHHGYAAELTVNTQQGSARSLQASLRIPAGELARAVSELKALGAVESESQKGEEVTQQHSDLAARLKNSRETETRLQSILQQRTGKMSDVLEVEQEISRVRGEIEGMEAELNGLEHRVDFTTVELTIAEEYRVQLSTPSLSNRLRNAAVSGFQSAADSVLGILLFGMNYGPSLVLWLAILILPGRFAWKRWRGSRLIEAR